MWNLRRNTIFKQSIGLYSTTKKLPLLVSYYLGRPLDSKLIGEKLYPKKQKVYEDNSLTVTLDKKGIHGFTLFDSGSISFYYIPQTDQAEQILRIRKLFTPYTNPDIAKFLMDKTQLDGDNSVSDVMAPIQNLRGLSHVLAQSVAMDYYVACVSEFISSSEWAEVERLGRDPQHPRMYDVVDHFLTCLGPMDVLQVPKFITRQAEHSVTYNELRQETQVEGTYKDLMLKLQFYRDRCVES